MLDAARAANCVADCGQAIAAILNKAYPGCTGEEALAILTPVMAIYLRGMVADGTFDSFDGALQAFNTIMPAALALVEDASPTMAAAGASDTSWGFDE
jgi:hypothetical protein